MFGGGRMRSFLAVTCPDDILPDLAVVAAGLPVRDWRAIHAGQRHLTLRFLGDQPEGLLRGLAAQLGPELSRVPLFRLEFIGLGAFPSRARPDVLWAGCGGDGVARLLRLAAAVDAGLAAAGLPPEGRPFRPHLTIGRRRPDVDPARAAAAVEAVCAAHAGRRWGAVDVARVVLFRSDLGPAGARHTPLAHLPLASGAHLDIP